MKNSSRNSVFRFAVRKFGPFEAVIPRQWESFCAATGCGLRLDAVPLDLHPLHDTLFAEGGLAKGEWDVACVSTDWLAEAHASGALLDLAPRIRRQPPDDYPGGWAESLLRCQRFEDRVLGLPFHDGPECFIYRKDLLEREGIPLPRTWDELHQAARRLHRPSERVWGTAFAAFPDGHNTVYDFCLQLWTRGGKLFAPDGRLILDSEPAREGMDFYRRIVNDAQAVHPKCRDFDSVQCGYAFARGEVALMVNWFAFASMCESLPESVVRGRVSVGPVPSAPGHPGASLNCYWILGIGAGSPHAETAYAFLRHCASAPQDKLLTLAGAIGCRKSTWQDAEINRLVPYFRTLDEIHLHARELPRLVHWSRIGETIDRLVLDTINTDRPIAEVCREAQARADRLIA